MACIWKGLQSSTTPNTLSSSLGNVVPSRHSNLNLLNNRARYKKTAFLAKDSPVHDRFPAENDMTPCTCSWPFSSKKRSGRKLNGSTQISGSWCMAQRLRNTVVSRGILNPARDVSRVVEWGTASGVSLTIRRTSVINAFK